MPHQYEHIFRIVFGVGLLILIIRVIFKIGELLETFLYYSFIGKM